MPLESGNSRAVIGRNIHELTVNGSRPRSHSQIVAIALSNADKYPHKAGGGGIGHPEAYHLMPSHGIGAAHPHIMSAGEGSPWWTRSSARMEEQPMRHGFAEGGGIGLAQGGVIPASEGSPWWSRSEARIADVPFHGGLIDSSLPGRTDRLPLDVPSESHVITADSISGLGQGGTKGGARLLTEALRIGPYGVPLPHAMHAHTIPQPPTLPHSVTGFAQGGNAPRVSILAAGSEYVVPLEDWVARDEQDGELYLHRGVRSLGEGDIRKGHDTLDEMMRRIREHTKAFLKSAPPPKK